MYQAIIKLVVVIVFLYTGIHLIIHNETVTKNLLIKPGIFEKKEMPIEDRDISPRKLKFNRTMIYAVGIVFIIGGIAILLNLLGVLHK